MGVATKVQALVTTERFGLYERRNADKLCQKGMRRKITNETWEQIKTGYAAGVNLREIARKMDQL
jgi:hypothetical protein